MLLKTAKDKVIKMIREYSNAGRLITDSRNLDYLLPMNRYFDTAQKKVAQVKKINATHKIVQNYIPNALGEFFNTVEHINDDLTYSVPSDASAFYFEVSDDAIVYVEEETATDVWTLLDTVTHTKTSGLGFESIKRLITASDPENAVRLRFSGPYYYSFRNLAIFTYPFKDLTAVPDYRIFREYSLPSTFYEIDNVLISEDNSELVGSDFQFIEDGSNKKLLLNYKLKGEFLVKYYKMPDDIPNDDTNSSLYDETYEFEIDIDAIEVMLLYVCYLVKNDEDPYLAGLFREEYYEEIQNLSSSQVTGVENVTDSYGWV